MIDLTIHIADDNIIKDVKEFLKKTGWSYEDGNYMEEVLINGEWKSFYECVNIDLDKNYEFRYIPLEYDEDAVYTAPGIYIGEVGLLKSEIFDNKEKYIPSTVELISILVGNDLPIIDDKFIDEVKKAFSLSNTSQYHVTDENSVLTFLNEHKGARVFQIYG